MSFAVVLMPPVLSFFKLYIASMELEMIKPNNAEGLGGYCGQRLTSPLILMVYLLPNLAL